VHDKVGRLALCRVTLSGPIAKLLGARIAAAANLTPKEHEGGTKLLCVIVEYRDGFWRILKNRKEVGWASTSVQSTLEATDFKKQNYWGKNKQNGAEDDLILSCSFRYLRPFLRYIGARNIKKKHPPPLIFGKHCHDCAVQGRLDSYQYKK